MSTPIDAKAVPARRADEFAAVAAAQQRAQDQGSDEARVVGRGQTRTDLPPGLGGLHEMDKPDEVVVAAW